jgi:RNA polymerase primary sigma factor
VPTNSSPEAKLVAAILETPAKKKPGRPPKNPATALDGEAPAKRGRKAKGKGGDDGDEDMSDIETEFEEEETTPEATTAATTEKVKPLRMKISKAKERALMKEFGLDETVQNPRLPDTRRNL